MLDLLYIEANANVPKGVVTSTARRGDKWDKQVKVGDTVYLKVTESGRVFGRAVIVGKELTTFLGVLGTAEDNHDGQGLAPAAAFAKLSASLKGAYGDDLSDAEVFTKLHILPLND